jgi:hypothetical protein
MLEAVVVLFSLTVLFIVLWPAFTPSPRKVLRFQCMNNLKQMGLAFRLWEGDHNDKYPMALSVTNGGAMEAVLAGDPMPVFQVMSNELATPKILVCPQDKRRHPARDWITTLQSTNLSYFVNPDALEANPQDVMIGDDNLEIRGVRLKSGLAQISTNDPILWTAGRHKYFGYFGVADGSAQLVGDPAIRSWFHLTNSTTVRLAIP